MRNTMTLVVAMSVIVAVYLGTRLAANQPASSHTAQQSRIACVNIVTVFQQYEKAKAYNQEAERLVEAYKVREENVKKKILRQLEEAGKADPAVQRARAALLEQSVENDKKELERLKNEVGDQINKKIGALFVEMNQAIEGYAKKHDIQLVLGFGENSKETFGWANISRKIEGMQSSGSTTPMYMAPGVDISFPVAESLNRAYSAGKKSSKSS